MWFNGERQPNTLYVASVSRGKDSTAMLRAIQLMGWPLDAVCSVDIWFDENTPAELPPMVAFKDEWDRKCLENFGIPVTRLCAHKREREAQPDGECHSPETYSSYFYKKREDGQFVGANVGFPMQRGAWCKKLKYEQVDILRYLLPQIDSRERERERMRMGRRLSEERRQFDCRIPTATEELVQWTTQDVYGFPMQRGNWCTALKTSAERNTDFRQELLRGVSQNSKEKSWTGLFGTAPAQGAKDKYCALHRNSKR